MMCRLFTKSRIAKKLPGLFSTSRRASSSTSPPTDWNSHSEFFDYTNARFVCNEKYEMEMRHVSFDMNELAKLAAKSVGAAKCVNVEKLSEGMFSKPFLFTMEDGSQVVGKVPNPNAGLPHFTTASEVATMDFVRNVLGTPVPKVLAWSSKANESPVGAEFIIMEMAPGVQLSTVWGEMGLEARFKIIKTIGGIQNEWASTSFPQYGSLYYASDLDHPRPCILTKRDGSQVEEPRFAVGPSMGREQFDDGRIAVQFDRGPWDTVEQCKRAVGLREIACIKAMTTLPHSPLGLYGPGTYTRCRSKKLGAAQNYLQIFKYLLPTDPSLSASFLWHDDLHVENIFVNPEAPWEISSIIDWQSTELLPLMDHARQPFFLDYDGPPPDGLEEPQMPANFSEMSPDEQAAAKVLHSLRSLSALYKLLMYRDTRNFYKAMEFRETVSFKMLIYPRKLLTDGEALYQKCIQALEEEWTSLPGVQAAGNPPFPVRFSTDEVTTIERDVDDTERGMGLMQKLELSLGDLRPEHGMVRHDQYDDVKCLLKEHKAAMMQHLAFSDEDRRAWDNSWPFGN
ncbi:hypothetical protein N7481_009168 [Penicillium waksmanii]|uniref:uncharacterized protein n=1 Tax=Penicillium waksmanii TaxID=69791 RepID=UPI002546E77E|nr:uncharacterized protein N7481_009168 [Penicillium waksmanii]KAJ5975461.1 hypothetical protein N7481_009168 [Penicillium waksmanii]